MLQGSVSIQSASRRRGKEELTFAVQTVCLACPGVISVDSPMTWVFEEMEA